MHMKDKQFDHFWEVRCPKCNEIVNIEVLINQINDKKEKK